MASKKSGRLSFSSGPKPVPVSHLRPGMKVERPLYHETATPIFSRGEEVCPEHLRALKKSGVEELYECRDEDDLRVLAAATTKRPVSLAELSVGVPLPFNLYDGANRFLLRKGRVLQPEHRRKMQEQEHVEIYADEEERLRECSRYGLELLKAYADRMERGFKGNALRPKTGRSLLPEVFARLPKKRGAAALKGRRAAADNGAAATADVLDALQRGRTVDAANVAKIVGEATETVWNDAALALNLTQLKDGEPGEFVHHAYNVAVLAVGVGLAQGYDEKTLRELGLAALLHEVGMLLVPREIIAKKEPLTTEEREAVKRHPLYAMDALSKVRGIPDSSALTVYQEHERPDRGGYPNRRPASLTHDFAKIVSVCDVYEALTAPRCYRNRATPYGALEEMVNLAAKLQLDPVALRGLLKTVGLFPIGSWVQLSTGAYAKVIAGNAECYDQPTVRTLYSAAGKPLPAPAEIDLGAVPEITVAAVPSPELFPDDLLLGF